MCFVDRIERRVVGRRGRTAVEQVVVQEPGQRWLFVRDNTLGTRCSVVDIDSYSVDIGYSVDTGISGVDRLDTGVVAA
jgi:hypothetical protein